MDDSTKPSALTKVAIANNNEDSRYRPIAPLETDGLHSEDDEETGGGSQSKSHWYRPSDSAKKWAWRAFTVDLPVTIIVIAVIFTIGILSMSMVEEEPTDFGQVDYMRIQKPFDPRQYLFNSSSNGTSEGADQKLLSPYNQSFPTDFNILLEPHLHTLYSDGRLTVKQAFDWAIINGFNALVVTDHNTIGGLADAMKLANSLEYSNKLVVLPGMEFTSCRLHMNLIGSPYFTQLATNNSFNIEEITDPTIKDALIFLFGQAIKNVPFPTDEQIRRVISSTHLIGGVVSVNHIPWSTRVRPRRSYREPTIVNHPSRQQLLEWGVDFFEVVNGDTFDLVSAQFVQRNANLVGMISGTDMHYGDSPSAWTILKAAQFTRESVMAELLAKRVTFLFDASGIPVSHIAENSSSTLYQDIMGPRNLAYDSWLPFTGIGGYLGIFYEKRSAMIAFQGGARCASGYFQLNSGIIAIFIAEVSLMFVLFQIFFYILWRICRWLLDKRKS